MTHDLPLWFLAATILPSLVVSFAAGFVVRRGAPRWGLVDHPAARKVHVAPTPLGGGLALWLAVVGPFAAGQMLLWLIHRGMIGTDWLPALAVEHLGGLWAQSGPLWVLLGAATILMLVGLADDRWGLGWKPRLAVQLLIAGLCVVWQGWRFTLFLDLPVLTAILSVIWIVGLINSFNMLDNMDGLSSGIAAIASTILAVVLLTAPASNSAGPQLFVGGFLLVLVGALVGFLWHNRPVARLFMGDAGSYFVGFCVAISTLLASYAEYGGQAQHAVLAPLVVMAVPLYDTITVVWIRIRQGRSPFHPDKNHFSHRLVELGLTKGQAVLTIYLTTITCGLGALLLRRVDAFGAGVILLMVFCLLALIAILEATSRRRAQGND